MLRQQSSFFLILLMILLLLFPSCAQVQPKKYRHKDEQPAESDMIPMPRADPGYLQYLERNSLLVRSSEMAKVVSGSELAWRSPGSSGGPDELLSFADNWLSIHPLTILTSSRSSAFGQLNDPAIWPILRETGLKGLYVAPVQGSGALWAKNRPAVDTGEDVVQYAFSRAAGNENEYHALMTKVMDNHSLLGSDLVPAATGLGPDFFLAARNVREYPGVYCMVDIPQELWQHLPEVASEWDTAALDQSQIDALNGQGLLPKAMRDTSTVFGKGGGWAATGEVRGVDGNTRRWVYRYYGTPRFAVLNWEDPSKTASRILSGGAVQQVGLRGQALVGLKLEAFQGLEAAPTKAGRRDSFNVEPALTAATSLSREIRRYNGWSWVRDDNLPLTTVADFLRSGSDFIFDSAFSPAAEHALLTGDTTLACFMADELLRLNIDTRRLVHTTPSQDGINYSLPYLQYLETTAVGADARAFRNAVINSRDDFISHMNPSPVQNSYLYTTSAGLAAMALNLPKSGTKSQASEVAKGHSLLIFFKAMQPGMLMISGQDLAGVMPLHFGSVGASDVANSSRGSYALTSASESLSVTNMGMPRAQQVYPAPDKQVHEQGSFLRGIGNFLRVRTQSGLAKGTLIARPRTKSFGVISLLTRMPGGNGFVLSVCNFSRDRVTENISLSGIPGLDSALGNVKVVSLGGSHSVSGRNVTVNLGPWEARALFFGSAAQGIQSVSSGRVTAVNPLTAPPVEQLVATPVDVTAPTQGRIDIPAPRGEAPPSPAASIAAPSGEPSGQVVPLARISEETAGKAKVRTLRPDQPLELVTTLPSLGGSAARQSSSGKGSASPAASSLFGGQPGDLSEPSVESDTQPARQRATAKRARRPAAVATKPPATPPVRATQQESGTAAVPAAVPPPGRAGASAASGEQTPPAVRPPVQAVSPPSASPDSTTPATTAPVRPPVAAQTPEPQAPPAAAVQPAPSPPAGEQQIPTLPPRRARTHYTPASDEPENPSSLPVRRRAPSRTPDTERTSGAQPSGSVFTPAVYDASGILREPLIR